MKVSSNPKVYREDFLSTINLIGSNKKIIPSGTRVIIVDNKIPHDALEEIIRNFNNPNRLYNRHKSFILNSYVV